MGKKQAKCFYELENLEITKDEQGSNSSESAFEKVLDDVGSEHRFQKFMIVFFMLPLAICNSLGSANTTLLLTTPDHSCHVPGRSTANVSLELWKNLTIPWEDDVNRGIKVRSSCSMFNISTEEINELLYDIEDYGLASNDSYLANISTVECQNGWDFDNSSWRATPVSDFEWVCDEKQLVTNLFSLAFAGNAIGTLFFSMVSDRFGRKKTFFVVLLMNVVCSVSSLFSPNFGVYSTLKFLLGLAYYSLYQIPYIIVIELCGAKLRSVTAVSSFLACVIGTCLVSLFAFLSAHWKLFILICHLPSLFFFTYCRILPESPRWLLSQSRVAECEVILKRIAQTNKRSYTERTRRLLLLAQKEETKKGSLKSIMTSGVLAKHLILTCSLQSIAYVLYVGLILNIHNLGGNKVLNFLILTLVEIPGNVMGSLSAHYLGRRLSIVVYNGLSGFCCLMAIYVITDEIALISLCAFAKMFSTALCLNLYMQTGELFPTPLRSTAFGVTAVVSVTALIFIPPLIAVGGSNAFLPYYTLFGIGLFGLALGTLLPETLGIPLPQTVAEAVKIGQNQPFFSFIHKWNAHQYREKPTVSEQHRLTNRDYDEVFYGYELSDKI